MEKFFASVIITANIVALQGLPKIPVTYAQSAKDLQSLESVSLVENEDGSLLIPGVGGERLENADTAAPAHSLIEGDVVAEDRISDDTKITTDSVDFVTPSFSYPAACRVNDEFPIIIFCGSF